ncbi:MAG: hypothetical protein RLZZ303_839 [Candidatus Hydrogenedentota bacterium]|jgi:hypothetical protein
MVRKTAEKLVAKARKAASKRTEAVTAGIEDTVGMVNDTIDKAIKRTEALRDSLEKSAEDTAEQTTRRAAKLALAVVEFQKTTFHNTFKVLGQVQDQSTKAVSGMLLDADWLPREGKQVVREWSRVLHDGRKEFEHTVDKSFELVTHFLERMQDGKPAKKKASPAKKSAAKKPVAKKPAAKKAAVKKPVAKKPAPAKKPVAKKPAAKKAVAKK